MYVCMYVCMYVDVCICVYMSGCMYAYVCMCRYMYVYVYCYWKKCFVRAMLRSKRVEFRSLVHDHDHGAATERPRSVTERHGAATERHGAPRSATGKPRSSRGAPRSSTVLALLLSTRRTFWAGISYYHHITKTKGKTTVLKNVNRVTQKSYGQFPIKITIHAITGMPISNSLAFEK